MDKRCEAVADMADWPANVPGKPTQVVVVGVYHPKKGKAFEVLWTGQFPDLQPAMYWAAKKEVEAVRKGKWMMASRVLWQHDITPEQAVEGLKKTIMPQLDNALRSARGDGIPDMGPGPMRQVLPDEPVPRYVEISPTDRPDETLAAFVIPPPDPYLPRDPRPQRPQRQAE